MKMRKHRIKQIEATVEYIVTLEPSRYYCSNGGHRKGWNWK